MEASWRRHWKFWLEHRNLAWIPAIIISVVLFGWTTNVSRADEDLEIKVDETMKLHMKPASYPDMFYFTHWFGYDYIPNIEEDSITSYDGLAFENGFYRARRDAENRLVYLESWSRSFTDVDLSTPVGTETLGTLYLPDVSDILDSSRVRTFVQNNTDLELREIPYAQTEGENQFILLRMLPAIVEGMSPLKLADIVDQYVSEAEEFHYSPDGTLQRIVKYRAENGFEPVEILIK